MGGASLYLAPLKTGVQTTARSVGDWKVEQCSYDDCSLRLRQMYLEKWEYWVNLFATVVVQEALVMSAVLAQCLDQFCQADQRARIVESAQEWAEGCG